MATASIPAKKDQKAAMFGRWFLGPGFLSHLRFLRSSYDEPEILSSQLSRFCLMGADPGQGDEVLG